MEDAVRLILATGEFLEYSFAECDFTQRAVTVQLTTLYMMGITKKKMAGRWITIRKKRIMSTLKMRFPTLLCLR